MAYSNNRSTFFCPAGTKWYWEFVPTTGYNYAACGITTNSHEKYRKYKAYLMEKERG